MVQERTRMTADEFFQLPETTQPTELIDGELIVSPAPILQHQLLVANFHLLLARLIPNGLIFLSPTDVYFDETNVPQPDISWVAENSLCVLAGKRLEGPPDLILEIFSPGTAKRDKQDKFKLYEKHGVREYWMVDPIQQYLEAWVLVDGRYSLLGVYGADDIFDSPVLGKVVSLNSIFVS
ncbi:MAG: Uma2 family endonuclease [Burkholderiales bacterium]|nr:Uma2 family endonuclease [Anaerolineae bacterium]